MLIRDYYQFRVHEVGLQTSIPTERNFQRFAYSYLLAKLVVISHCNMCVAQDIRTMLT